MVNFKEKGGYIEERSKCDTGLHLEQDLPLYLHESLERYKDQLRRLDAGEKCPYWDCWFCDLQSDINVAELDESITKEQADYLRKEYLYG